MNHDQRDQLAVMLSSVVLAPIIESIEALGSAAEDEVDAMTADYVLGHLPEILGRWPVGLVRLSVQAMWLVGVVDNSRRNDALAAIDESAANTTGSTMVPGDGGDLTIVSGEAPVEIPPVLPSLAGLERLVVEHCRAALETGVGDMNVAADYLACQPLSPAAWYAAGLSGTDTTPPPSDDLGWPFVLGVLERSSLLDDMARTLRVAVDHPAAVERILHGPEGAKVEEQVFAATLGQPALLARFADAAVQPCPSRRLLLDSLRQQVLDAEEHQALVILDRTIRVVEGLLRRWHSAAAEPEKAALESDIADAGLLQAECRRHRCDFAGARAAIKRLDARMFGLEKRWQLWAEAAYAIAEVVDPSSVMFPPTPGVARQVQQRLSDARELLVACLHEHPGEALASLLYGLLLYLEADTRASSYLDAARSALGEAPPVSTELEFHWGIAQLRRLEAGTAQAALGALRRSLNDGYSPPENYVVEALELFEVHGEDVLDDALGTLAAALPKAAHQVLAERAAVGSVRAAQLAEELADRTPAHRAKADLLEAALIGATVRNDAAAALRVAGQLDEALAALADPEAERRFAALLASSEALRDALVPDVAELRRIEVLRRTGDLDDALGAALALFHRAAAGATRQLDGAVALELLDELGLAADELTKLRHLVKARSAVEADPLSRTEVIFVGGDEHQARQVAPVEEMLRERFGDRIVVHWVIPGWGSNWPSAAERVQGLYATADVVVLMALVRTQFGEWVRRTAGERGLPWVACPGHGRGSMTLAIERAVLVAGDIRAAGG